MSGLDKRVWFLFMLLPFVVVAIVASGGDEPKKRPPPVRAIRDLTSIEATQRDYKNAGNEARQDFVEWYVQLRFGQPDPLAVVELRAYLDRDGSLPVSGSHTHMLLAATGKTKLRDVAARAAEVLGWPDR